MKRVAVQYVLCQGANIVAVIVEVLQSKLAHPSSFFIFRVLLQTLKLQYHYQKIRMERTPVLVDSNIECGFIATTTLLTHQIHIFVF